MATLDEVAREATSVARTAAPQAYCPYSGFHVGAAVVTAGGKIFPGCNVENASYGLTICAERNAIFQAVAGGETVVRLVVVYTPTAEPVPPCGACRQVLHEFGPDSEVLAVCDGPGMRRWRLTDLLPGAFGPQDLSGSA
jgi:cytidine deaminase